MSSRKWLYKLEETGEVVELSKVEDFPLGTYGFVYRIINICTGRAYIGRKVLYNNLNKTLTNREIAAWSGPGRVPKRKKVQKESNWENYWGSNREIKEDLKNLGEECFTREILTLCKNKKQMTYYEIYWQMHYRVLHVDSYNDNINGKFYRRDLE